MDKSLKVSIIILSYNQENYISKAIESILRQNHSYTIELIVADDYSTDNTLSIIHANLKEFKGDVKVLDSNKNLGISKNYQRAFEACSGEYIFILEGDDYWTDPLRIGKHVQFLENHRECVMTVNRFVWFHEQVPKYIVEPWKRREAYYYVNTQEMAEGNKLGNLSACVFRSETIKRLNPAIYEMEIADWMLGMAVSEYGLIAILEDVMSVYRIHGHGQWAGLSKENQTATMLLAIDKYDAFFEKRYTKSFDVLRKQLTHSKKSIASNIKPFIPPFLWVMAKNIIPPLLVKHK